MKFDNHDDRLRYYELLLEKKNVGDILQFPLPEGYRFVFYKPGDRDTWINIEMSAKEFTSYEQGIASWNRYFQGKDEELISRMVFVQDEKGEKVATATAFYDIYGRDQDNAGWLHWVAVRRDHQGKGLSKPLIGYVLHLLPGLGYSHFKIPTQTNTWLACKIYLDLGFRPIPQNAVNSLYGWRMIKTLTDHPALKEYESLPWEELVKPDIE